jgi:hypothetical protein
LKQKIGALIVALLSKSYCVLITETKVSWGDYEGEKYTEVGFITLVALADIPQVQILDVIEATVSLNPRVIG